MVFLLLFFKCMRWPAFMCVCECTSVWKLEGVILWYRSLIGVDWPESPRDAPVSASPALALQAYITMLRFLCWFGRFKLRFPFLQASTLSIAQSPIPLTSSQLAEQCNGTMCFWKRYHYAVSSYLDIKLLICWISYVGGRCLFIKDVNCSIKMYWCILPLCNITIKCC